MKIDKDAEIGRVSLREVRTFFRATRNGCFSLGSIREGLNLTKERASVFLDAIKNENMVEPGFVGQVGGEYELSLKGRAFALAKFTKRFNRAAAQKYVDALLVRVEEINARDELTHRVREVRVFGSYIEDTDDLGDINAAVDLEPRDSGKSATARSFVRARASGRTLSFRQELQFGETEVKRLLRARLSRISICDLSELSFLECRSVVIFPPDAEHK